MAAAVPAVLAGLPLTIAEELAGAVHQQVQQPGGSATWDMSNAASTFLFWRLVRIQYDIKGCPVEHPPDIVGKTSNRTECRIDQAAHHIEKNQWLPKMRSHFATWKNKQAP